MNQLPETDLRFITRFQKNEITEHHIYKNLARRVEGVKNRRIFAQISEDELRHYNVWKKFTGKDVEPDRFRIWLFSMIAMLFGFTFAVKIMEGGEQNAQMEYERVASMGSEIRGLIEDEEEHEQALIAVLDEERLQYTGSIVLGLNDALVELTGALAGLTFALQNTQLVALTAMITGFAAALSMASSEYLSTKAEPGTKNPLKASIYTGVAYLIAVAVLIVPYLFLANIYLSLALAFGGALVVIALFNFYVSVAKSVPFKNRFLEMAGLIVVVSGISFLAGLGIRYFFGIEV
ncbi:rubrerythrin family protein [Chlorobaculum limnaeum]|uniref:Rubrerythrin family protein n=1 Tax=Chlorobaculum limnaeum TaxID=274537 RepID=A0A1D8D6T9_CHLLM|nr:VIT1/CCC1 transporter family protein [Chlorobaculum limnaeum]AOS83908.1 rubrerythrin family protein [Chlorobaculum limnaeum]